MPFKQKWSADDRRRVCNHITVKGNTSSKKVAKLTGIPHQTIRHWMGTEWWAEMQADIRKSHASRFDGRLTYLIDEMADQLLDRIQNGDEVLWAKTGLMLKKQMSGKDLSAALNVAIGNRALLRGDPTSRTEKTTLDKQMKSIQATLEKRTQDMRKAVADSENVEEIKKEA